MLVLGVTYHLVVRHSLIGIIIQMQMVNKYKNNTCVLKGNYKNMRNDLIDIVYDWISLDAKVLSHDTEYLKILNSINSYAPRLLKFCAASKKYQLRYIAEIYYLSLFTTKIDKILFLEINVCS